MTDEKMMQVAINTIRTLSIDAVEQAKSGHPGTPMALAPLVYTLRNRVMQFDSLDPIWPNRNGDSDPEPVLGTARLRAAGAKWRGLAAVDRYGTRSAAPVEWNSAPTISGGTYPAGPRSVVALFARISEKKEI